MPAERKLLLLIAWLELVRKIDDLALIIPTLGVSVVVCLPTDMVFRDSKVN